MKKDINETFKEIEDRYKSGDQNASWEMLLFMRQCIGSMMMKYIKNRSLLWDKWSKDEIEEKIDIGAYWFLERYLKNPDFTCKFTSYLPFAFQKAMFGNEVRKIEQEKENLNYLLKEANNYEHIVDDGGYYEPFEADFDCTLGFNSVTDCLGDLCINRASCVYWNKFLEWQVRNEEAKSIRT